MTITMDDLRKWRCVGTMHLDFADHYENHAACTDNPRLTMVNSGPRGRKSKRKHEIKYFVDGMECPDLDAVLTMLNSEPIRKLEAGR